MADFAESGEIISRCLGYRDNAFINAYQKNIDNQNDEIIESSPVAETVITFMENKMQWIGTPTILYQLLCDIISQVDPDVRKSKYWPKGPNRMTRKLNEYAPNLLKKNIEIVTGDKDSKGKRIIRITKLSLTNSLGDNGRDKGQK